MSTPHRNQQSEIGCVLRRSLLISVCAVVLCSSVYAEPIIPDKVTNQEITVPLSTATVNDYLLDMARATKINILADSTDFPVESSVKSYPATSGAIAGLKGKNPEKWDPRLINVMGDFAAQEKLSVLRPEPRIFLFWSEPELHSLYERQRIVTNNAEDQLFAESVAAAKADGISERETIAGEISEAQLKTVLLNYLKSQYGWSGVSNERTAKIDLQTGFEDVPISLRALILSDIRNRCVRSLKRSWWNEDELRLRAKEDGKTTTLLLEYRNVNEDGKPGNWTNFPFVELENPPIAQEVVATSPLQETPPATSQIGPKDTLLNAYSDLGEKAVNPALEADGALQKSISLNVKRLVLSELLQQLEKQSGIRFKADGEATTSKLVTASIEQMPLSKVMGLLERVYGVTWSKGADASYEMHGNERGQLHMQLLQMGDPIRYRFRFAFYKRADRANEEVSIGREIIQHAGLEALQAPEGIAFSTLPQTLQERLRHSIQDPGMESGARMLYSMNRTLVEQITKKGLILRFGTSVRKTLHSPFLGFDGGDDLPSMLRFTVQSEDGQINLPVFDSFTVPVAQAGEEVVRQPSRRR